MSKRAPIITLVLSVFLLSFFLLFTNVNLASAQEDSDAKTSESVPAIEQILRVELTPSLNADSDQETSVDGSRVAMFRLYNRWTGEHFYTSSKSERDDIVKAGWVYEQIEWYAPTSEDFKPVYRLYNKYVEGGDHHYTTSADEKDECVKAGWTYEGEGWRTVEAGATDYVKVLRQYNPYATTGTHNYTTDEDEQKYLVSLGWRAEADGGWGGYSKLEPSTQAIDFANKAVVDQTDKTYTSKAITPKATVTGLTAGTDYVVTYSDNVNAGTATIKIEGKGAYTGSKEWLFTIKPLDISSATITLGDSLVYNGYEQTQSVASVKVRGLTVPVTDYSVSNNKQVYAGTYKDSEALKVEPSATNNLTGQATKEYSIEQLDISGATVTLGDSLIYTGYEQTQSVVSVKVGEETVSPADYDVSDDTRIDAGTYTLVVSGTNNCTGQVTKEFVIDVADITDAEIVIDPNVNVFSGSEITPSVTVTLNFETLVVDTDYTLGGDLTKTDVGTYTITATGIGNYKNTVTGEWRIDSIGDYWLNVASSDTPESDILKTQAQIDEDMKVLHGEKDKTFSGKDKAAVEEEYAYYMNEKSAEGTEDQEVRLYTKWNTATGESGGADTTGKNAYVEFRIIQVGEHDSDGSAVTFMATHSLPTAKQMNSTDTNAGGWADSLMRNTTMSTYVKEGLSDLCTIDESTGAKTINKVTTSGSYGSWVENSTTADQFWLLSQTEVFGTAGNTLVPTYFKSTEGTQYDWFTAKGVNAKSAWDTTNTAIANMNLTRAGINPAGSGGSGSGARYWLRSPDVSSSIDFGRVGGSYGNPTSGGAQYTYSVVPAFSF